MKLKVNLQSEKTENAVYIWENRQNIFSDAVVNAKTKKKLNEIKRFIKKIEKKVKEDKVQKDRIVKYLEKEGYPIEYI